MFKIHNDIINVIALKLSKTDVVSLYTSSKMFHTSLNHWLMYRKLIIVDAVDEDLETVHDCYNLDIRKSNITDLALTYVSQVSCIQILNLNGNNSITDQGLYHLSTLKHIWGFDISDCELITDIGLEHISEMTSITTLSLVRNDSITDLGLEHISNLHKLKTLYFSSARSSL